MISIYQCNRCKKYIGETEAYNGKGFNIKQTPLCNDCVNYYQEIIKEVGCCGRGRKCQNH